MGVPRAAQKAITRGLFLDAGLELFIAQGYAATTVEDIAAAAHSTRVTFYSYFRSKAELMRALIDERLNAILARSRSPEGGSRGPDLVEAVADGSREALEGWLRTSSSFWPVVRPILRIGRDAAAVEPELADLVARWIEEAVGDIEEALEGAGRFEPHQRRFRGVLAMAELDFVAQHWDSSDWRISEDQMFRELGVSWTSLLGASADGA